MKNNFLLIVEGKETEPNIFQEVLKRYGFNVIRCKEKLDFELLHQFDEYNLELGKTNVVIIQGPRNRIHDLLKQYKENEYSFEKMLGYHSVLFQGIFLMYDVDHNDCNDINEMYDKFNDESRGMLLLSSPCIEVLGDYNLQRKDSKYNHLKEYKADLNDYYNEKDGTNTISYIIDNFEDRALYFLKKNKDDFNEKNVMEHPKLIIDNINKYNERVNFKEKDQSYVIYRYYTTVVYVFIAFINNLVKEINNYEEVRKWFIAKKLKMKQKNS